MVENLDEINRKLDLITAQLDQIKRLLPHLTTITYKQDGVEKQEIVWVDSYGNSLDAAKLHYGSIKEMEADAYRLPPKEEIRHWSGLNSNICNGDRE